MFYEIFLMFLGTIQDPGFQQFELFGNETKTIVPFLFAFELKLSCESLCHFASEVCKLPTIVFAAVNLKSVQSVQLYCSADNCLCRELVWVYSVYTLCVCAVTSVG